MIGNRAGSCWALLFGFFVFLVAVRPCQALQFDVFIGYGGIVREVGWFPVSCEVMNDGAAFTGTIEITGTYLGSKQRRRVTLELPTNTRKRAVIPVFYRGGGLPSWDARLYDENGKLQAEQSGVRVKEVAWEGVLMGSVARTFAGTPKFPEIKIGSTVQPEVGWIPPEQFPDTAIALEGLSSIYLNSEQALKFVNDQVDALNGWVAFGGHLILAIEQPVDVLATPWLQPLCPFRPDGLGQIKVGTAFFDWLANGSPSSVPSKTPSSIVRNVVDGEQGVLSSVAGFGYSQIPRELDFENEEMPIVTGRQIDGEVLLATEDGIPLMISANRGRGQVTVLTFSPEREPFRSWKSKTWFWAKLNRVPFEWFEATDFFNTGGESLDGVFGSLIESRQVRKLPVGWLLLLLVVYLIMIGPFDHWWLKKINRQMLTWITFPAYVILFSLLIYFIGYRLRAGESEWNELHIVDVINRGEAAKMRGRSYAAIYSPLNARYDVQCPLPGASFRSEFLASGGGGPEAGDSVILLSNSGMNSRIFVPVWTSQLYVADWFHTAETPFTVKATSVPDGITVHLQNQGSQTVESIGVAAGGKFYQLAGLGPGESRIETLHPAAGQFLNQFVDRHSRNYLPALTTRKQALGTTMRIHGVGQNSMVSAFISQYRRNHSRGNRSSTRGFVYPSGMELTPALDRGEVVILAYYPNYSLIPWLNGFEVARSNRNTLLRLVVTPTSTSE